MSQDTRDGLVYTLARIRLTDSRVIFVESAIVVVLSWTLAAHIFDITNVISEPTAIGAVMYELVVTREFLDHLVPTLRRTVYGLLVTIVIGTALGIAMGMREWVEKVFQDYVTVGLAMPGLFIAIFTAMWFGISDVTPTVAAAIISFPFLTQQVYEGVRNIDNDILQMSSSFGVSNWRAMRRTVIPAVMPEWFAGTRYSLAIVWKTVTLTELVAASDGIGWIIRSQLERLDFTGAMAWTMLFVVVILTVEYGIVQQLENRIFKWRQEVSGVMAL
ncbi:ABC transporter permease [Salinigranum rubrum]|nr:ABC transporter permease subunit [Salinigranum rubrum]